jgi:hypothetical protein
MENSEDLHSDSSLEYATGADKMNVRAMARNLAREQNMNCNRRTENIRKKSGRPERYF